MESHICNIKKLFYFKLKSTIDKDTHVLNLKQVQVAAVEKFIFFGKGGLVPSIGSSFGTLGNCDLIS